MDELARCKASLLHQSDDTNHYIRLLLHERQMLFGALFENQKVVSRLKRAFDPLSVTSPKDVPNTPFTITSDSWTGDQIMSVLGLAELNLDTSTKLQERLLGAENRPKEITANVKSVEDLSSLQLDTPAEEGLRQVKRNIYLTEVDAGFI